MNCLIDSVIVYLSRQGKNAKAIRAYIRDRYRISIDVESIKARLKEIQGAARLT
jgi:hypothetical protein